ncbi:hypothetical protein WJX73_003242 [Symbiochloris irregularis]|uniref:Uncharacterized protein n=1 Tax=Symbiochloris irregularis TaxID=706552 RepID=A0AAW1PQ09_9CHLO
MLHHYRVLSAAFQQALLAIVFLPLFRGQGQCAAAGRAEHGAWQVLVTLTGVTSWLSSWLSGCRTFAKRRSGNAL